MTLHHRGVEAAEKTRCTFASIWVALAIVVWVFVAGAAPVAQWEDVIVAVRRGQ